MEDFDFSKIIWGAFVVIALLYRWFVQGAHSSHPNVEIEDFDESEDMYIEGADDLDFDSIYDEVAQSKRVSPSSSKLERPTKHSRRVVSNLKSQPQSQPQPQDSNPVQEKFDLRKAVIMSEILTPKFKEE